MPYGIIKVDTITFTDAGVDKSVSISGLVQNPTFTGNVTATGTISGLIVQAPTVTGTTANFASGVYTTQISGAIVKVPAGSAGAPSIQVGVGASVAPGLYGAGTDLLGISTGGAGRIFIDSTGRLGIGTSSPQAPLHVFGAEGLRVETSASNEGYIRFVNTSGSMSIGMSGAGGNNLLIYDRTNNQSVYSYIGGAGGSHVWSINNTERLRIDSSGRVGIGTSSPGALFDATQNANAVSQQIRLTNINTVGTVGSAIKFQGYYDTALISSDGVPGSFTGGDLRLQTYSNNGVLNTGINITRTGLVGIGTTAPVGSLEITGTSLPLLFQSTNATSNYITHKHHSSGDIAYIGAGGGAATTAGTANDYAIRANLGALIFATNGNNERARIDSSGNVGIGTTSPLTKLEVRSGAITAGNLESTNGSEILRGYYSGGGALTVLGTEYSSGGPILGSGVKPSTSAQGAFLSSSGTAGITRGAYAISGHTHKWYIGAAQTVAENSSVTMSEVMRIDSAGRVGIGTTAPATAVDVMASAGSAGAGNIRIAPSTSGQARYHLYNGGATAEWLFGQKTSTDHAFKLSKSVAGSEVDYLAVTTAGILQFDSGYGSNANAYGCRAWVNFNGTGTVTIRGSGNVSSITDNGIGNYTVNFTTAMPDANYAAVTDAADTTASRVTTYATGSARVLTYDAGLVDSSVVSVAVFR